jgi:hypothetical protein
MEPYKIILIRWINQGIDQFLIKENIKYRFKATCIWPLIQFQGNEQQDLTFRNSH